MYSPTITPEQLYHLLDATVVMDPWPGLPPGCSVAEWLVGPQGLIPAYFQGVDLGGVAPFFTTLLLEAEDVRHGHAWSFCGVRTIVDGIITMTTGAAGREGYDLLPVAFFRLIDLAGVPTPQFCFVDARDPIAQARFDPPAVRLR